MGDIYQLYTQVHQMRTKCKREYEDLVCNLNKTNRLIKELNTEDLHKITQQLFDIEKQVATVSTLFKVAAFTSSTSQQKDGSSEALHSVIGEQEVRSPYREL